MKLGVVANEFFDPTLGRMGGFGWAARQTSNFFNSRPDLNVRVVFLAGKLGRRRNARAVRTHGTTLISSTGSPDFRDRVRAEKPDLLLTIDYRSSYREVLQAVPQTPAIVWVRDPKPPEILANEAALTIPGDPAPPQGINRGGRLTLPGLVKGSSQIGRSLLFATPAASLASRVKGAYGMDVKECFFLPNIVDIDPGRIAKTPHPRVIFLARLDPIKRPWLFVELARLFPKVEFLMLGQGHFRGPGSWVPRRLPRNVELLGHVDGQNKKDLISSAWLSVNTSIHEALATSFLEALACETPLLACTDQEQVVSRFGLFTGPISGDGLRGLPLFVAALARLLRNHDLRVNLGKKGRAWVEATHDGAAFLKAFDELCGILGVTRRTDCRQRAKRSALPTGGAVSR